MTLDKRISREGLQPTTCVWSIDEGELAINDANSVVAIRCARDSCLSLSTCPSAGQTRANTLALI